MKLNLDKIVDIEMDGIDTYDYPDFCDAYISNAWYKISKQEFDNLKLEHCDSCDSKNGHYFRCLTDDELDWLNNTQGEFVYNQVLRYLY